MLFRDVFRPADERVQGMTATSRQTVDPRTTSQSWLAQRFHCPQPGVQCWWMFLPQWVVATDGFRPLSTLGELCAVVFVALEHFLGGVTNRLRSAKSAPAHPVMAPEMTKATSFRRIGLRPTVSTRVGVCRVAFSANPNGDFANRAMPNRTSPNIAKHRP